MSLPAPDPRAEAVRLVGRYRARGLLLDANLLLAVVVAAHDPRLIPTVKATRQFRREDLHVLSALVGAADRLVTTPHVLTEVNGLANTGVPRRLRWAFLNTVRRSVGAMDERTPSAVEATADPLFPRLGLTDAALLMLAPGGPLVASMDLDLCVALEGRGHDVINFNRIRFE